MTGAVKAAYAAMGTRWAHIKPKIKSAYDRIVAWLPTFLKVGGGVVAFVTFAGAVLGAWDVLDKESSPYRQVVPKIEVQASPKEVPVGEQTVLSLKVNTKQAAGQYHCLWEVTGVADGEKLIGGVKQDDCAPRPLKNFGVAFAKGETEQKIRVRATVADTTRLAKKLGWDSDEVEITLANRVNPSIEKPQTVPLNETTTLSAAFSVDGKSVPPAPPMHCNWTIDGRLMDGTECRISYKATPAIPTGKSGVDVKVGLTLLDGAGNQIGVKEDTIEVRRRIGDVYAYAIDTTKRMDNPGRGPGLNAVLASLEKTIRDKSLATASLAIRTFGGSDQPPGRCGKIDTIVPMAEFDSAKVGYALGQVKIDGDHAPVLLATRESLGDLVNAARDNSYLYLVVITGGPDDCRGGDEKEMLDMISATMRSASVPLRRFDLQMLGLTLRIASSGEAGLLIQQIPPATGGRAEVPHFQIVVGDEATLNRALNAIAGLSDADNARRRQSCMALAALLQEQVSQVPARQEDNSVNRLREYCSRNRR